MTHARTELLNAMRGVAPAIKFTDTPDADRQLVCGEPGFVGFAVWAVVSAFDCKGALEDTQTIDCPDCLRIIRASLDPESLVRLDWLEEREGAA